MALNRTDDTEPVRIAILDTGVNSSHPEIQKEVKPGGRIREYKGFPEAFDPLADQTGHGTHVTSVLLQTAPHAALYIARVADDTGDLCHDNEYKATAEVKFLASQLISKGNCLGSR